MTRKKHRKPSVAQVALTLDELRAELDEKIAVLQARVNEFDRGFTPAAKDIAVLLRTLLHDTAVSHSLLGQLGTLHVPFYDSAWPLNNDSVLSYMGLLCIISTPVGTLYWPGLDEGDATARRTDFRDWWESVVLIDSKKHSFTRKQLVLALANQGGGAHVAPTWDAPYYDLAKNNSLAFIMSSPNGEIPFGDPVPISVRQIAHEVLKTLVSGYIKLIEIPHSKIYRNIALVKRPGVVK